MDVKSYITLHYKEFITENKINSQSIIRFFILSFFKHNYISSFSMMTAILLFHASSNSSDPFHSPSQHMKNRIHGSIFDKKYLSHPWIWTLNTEHTVRYIIFYSIHYILFYSLYSILFKSLISPGRNLGWVRQHLNCARNRGTDTILFIANFYYVCTLWTRSLSLRNKWPSDTVILPSYHVPPIKNNQPR